MSIFIYIIGIVAAFLLGFCAGFKLSIAGISHGLKKGTIAAVDLTPRMRPKITDKDLGGL